MSIILEDGSGKSDAETYVDVATYRAFWVARNDSVIVAGTPTDAELEADLREAFAFVNQRHRYTGLKVKADQAGAFPRQYLYDREGNLVASVPVSVEEAQMRAARAHRDSPLFSRTERVGSLTRKRVEGVVDVSYDKSSRPAGNDAFDLIDELLAEWATSAPGSVRLLRA